MTARTAAASLMIFGGIVIVALSVATAGYAIANPSWIDSQLAGADPAVREQLDAVLTPAVITQIVVACGVGGVVEGAASIALGWFVSRGKRWAIRTSIAVTFFRIALVALLVVAIAAASTSGTAPSVDFLTIAFLVIASIVLLATLVFLFRSRRATPPTFPVAP